MATTKDAGEIKAALLSALRKLNEELTKMVKFGRESFQMTSLEKFLKIELGVGMDTIQPLFIYVDCLKAVDVQSRAELEEMWKSYSIKSGRVIA